jgi:glycosyltransferase involved in cell wall biosynthesis
MNLEPTPRIKVMRIIARMNVGGPAVQVSELMRNLETECFEHRLYAGYCGLDELDYLETSARDLEVFRVPGLGRHISAWSDIRALVFLIKAIRDFRPEIIHTHTAKAGFLGRLASIFSGHRSIRVHTFHGHLLNGYFSKNKTRLVVIAEYVLAKFTTYLLAVGDQVRTDLLKKRIGRVSAFGIMPPGISLGIPQNKSEARVALGLEPNDLYVAFIGRVTKIKRPDRFLDVVSRLKDSHPNLKYFVAGQGDLFEYTSNRVKQESLPVSLLGWQTNIELVLSASDIVVLTSDNEGTPISLIQAGMFGIPVVTTDVGAVHDVVLQGKTGLITSPSVIDIASAIQDLAENPEMRNSFGEEAKQFTISQFSTKRLSEDHKALYLQLVTNQASS